MNTRNEPMLPAGSRFIAALRGLHASAHAVLSPDGVRIRYDDLGAGLTKRDACFLWGRRDARPPVVT